LIHNPQQRKNNGDADGRENWKITILPEDILGNKFRLTHYFSNSATNFVVECYKEVHI